MTRRAAGAALVVVLIVWGFLTWTGMVAMGCRAEVDPDRKLTLCERALALNAWIPGHGPRMAPILAHRAAALAALGPRSDARDAFDEALALGGPAWAGRVGREMARVSPDAAVDWAMTRARADRP